MMPAKLVFATLATPLVVKAAHAITHATTLLGSFVRPILAKTQVVVLLYVRLRTVKLKMKKLVNVGLNQALVTNMCVMLKQKAAYANIPLRVVQAAMLAGVQLDVIKIVRSAQRALPIM